MEAEPDNISKEGISDDSGLTIICDTLSKEISKECANSPINTERIRMLTQELDKFKGLMVTSMSDITNRGPIPGCLGSTDMPVAFDERGPGSSMLDSIKDIAHLLLKNSENKALTGDTSDLISWYGFLGTVSQDLTDRSILSSGELMDLEDSVLTAIVGSMRTRVNNVVSFNDNAFSSSIENEV